MKYITFLMITLLFLGCSFKEDSPNSWKIKEEMTLYSIDGLYKNFDMGKRDKINKITASDFVNDERNALDFEKNISENKHTDLLHQSLEVSITDINESSIKYVQLKLDENILNIALLDNNLNTLKKAKKDVTLDKNNKSIYIIKYESAAAGTNVVVIAGGKNTKNIFSDGKYIYVNNTEYIAALMILPLPLPIVVLGNNWCRFKKIEKGIEE